MHLENIKPIYLGDQNVANIFSKLVSVRIQFYPYVKQIVPITERKGQK